MPIIFEEIDSQHSSIGEISLRKRRFPVLGDRDVYEVKLGDEFLMSSMFVEAEEALSRLGLAAIVSNSNLNVVVGGLGLGYTAVAALKDKRIDELLVVEALKPVVDWHKQELVPLGEILNSDPRNRYILGNFFDLAKNETKGFDPDWKGKQFDAILLDIDHSPSEYLHPDNASFYSTIHLSSMAKQLKPNGVFAMWSQNLPDKHFENLLKTVFTSVNSHVISFFNPFQNNETSNSIYVCIK